MKIEKVPESLTPSAQTGKNPFPYNVQRLLFLFIILPSGVLLFCFVKELLIS